MKRDQSQDGAGRDGPRAGRRNAGAPAWADEYDDTLALFRKADKTSEISLETPTVMPVLPDDRQGCDQASAAPTGTRSRLRDHRASTSATSTMNQLSIGFALGGGGGSSSYSSRTPGAG